MIVQSFKRDLFSRFPQICAENDTQIAADFDLYLRKSALFFCENLREMAMRHLYPAESGLRKASII
ncbi:MAG: hypothetical protein DYG98_21460 [Haliscomenobacteraceae bacterium CHB4]|nr:hypothetical protein [Haliscomenobacteraceae bacterium CHB4]